MEFRTDPYAPGYSCDRDGNIRGPHPPFLDKDGYLILRYKYRRVNVFVARCWVPNPMNLPIVDHKNHDRTDNRVANLRWVTRQQSTQNRRGNAEKGVTRTGSKKKPYCARYAHKHIGYFATKREALMAYNTRALAVAGEFACLNVVPDE
jgi:CDGSH-type Zn-finger protein